MARKKKTEQPIDRYCYGCKQYFHMTEKDFRSYGHYDKAAALAAGISTRGRVTTKTLARR